MSNIVEFVRSFVKEKHVNQKRWNGDPYFTHLEAVEKLALERWLKTFSNATTQKIISIIALSHDICEDIKEFENKEYKVVAIYRKADIHQEIGDLDWVDIIDALRRLNKNRYPNYLDFVLAARENPYSKIVKIGDLKHNSSDLKHGNMRDKYLMALYILENT